MPAACKNKPITTKEEFAYWKTSRPDKKHVEVMEDEEIVKNKFAYWKKPQPVSNQ